MTIRLQPNEKAVLAEMESRFLKAWNTGEYQGETQGFARMGQLFAVFSPKRWELIEKLQTIGPSSVRGLARALERDVKRVHADVNVLMEEHLIERTEDQKIFVPFETIRLEAELTAPKAA